MPKTKKTKKKETHMFKKSVTAVAVVAVIVGVGYGASRLANPSASTPTGTVMPTVTGTDTAVNANTATVEPTPNQPTTPDTPKPTAAPTSAPMPEPSPTPAVTVFGLTVYVPDAASGLVGHTTATMTVAPDADAAVLGAAFTKIFNDLALDDNYQPLIAGKGKINSVSWADSGAVIVVDLSSDYADELNVGAGIESGILQCIADTVGNYVGANAAQFTMDGMAYESGHISYKLGDTVKVNK